MEFGLQFFPSVGPGQKSAEDYWADALYLTELGEDLGFTSVRTVEHYFHPYGGYSPSPLVFLTAAAMVTKKMRLITGAVLPVFNNPLKMAGEIGMVDAISHGRLEVGFARAFLPHEFGRFGISMDESRARFDEGMEQVRLLLEEENVSSEGRFHSFKDITSLPRPTRKPRPPFWVASISTPESFEMCGRKGHSMMAIPLASEATAKLVKIYRDAWRTAGHAGSGEVMLAFNMFCASSKDEAERKAKRDHEHYLTAIASGAADWGKGAFSHDYPNYQKMYAALSSENYETTVAKGTAWMGTPDSIAQDIERYNRECGGFDSASLQINFGNLPRRDAEDSMRLFAKEVMPRFK